MRNFALTAFSTAIAWFSLWYAKVDPSVYAIVSCTFVSFYCWGRVNGYTKCSRDFKEILHESRDSVL